MRLFIDGRLAGSVFGVPVRHTEHHVVTAKSHLRPHAIISHLLFVLPLHQLGNLLIGWHTRMCRWCEQRVEQG